MSHLSWPAFGALIAAALVLAIVVIAAGPGKHGHGKRFAASLLAGAILAAFLVGWISATSRHAVATAAASGHVSTADIRADLFIGAALALTVILFVITTALQRSSRARTRTRELQPVRRRATSVR